MTKRTRNPSAPEAAEPKTQDDEKGGDAPEAAEPTREPTPEGFATRLFHVDCPAGRRFVGAEADEAMENGWVDSPAKLKR